MKPSEVTVITFATFGRSVGHRDYTSLIARMEGTCRVIGCSFLAYTFRNNPTDRVMDIINRRLPMRKGAGYWAWKPQVILKALESANSRYLLYLDSDLRILKLPSVLAIPRFSETGLALFQTLELLEDWTSGRCLEAFGLKSNLEHHIFSASAILLDRDNPNCIKAIEKWEEMMQDDRLLLDPLSSIRLRHRHDQSILSCLVAKHEIDISILPKGFYQSGLENGDLKPEHAWLIHGNTENQIHKSKAFPVRNLQSYMFHKIQLAIYTLGKKLKSRD